MPTHRAALIGYLPAGFRRWTARGADARMVDGGCDVVEVGLPYSDPVMDGPTIQAAAEAALARRASAARLRSAVEAIAGSVGRGSGDDLLEPGATATVWTRSPATSPRPAGSA